MKGSRSMARHKAAKGGTRSKSQAHREVAADPNPYVIVDFEFDRGALFIAIENIGTRPAFCVRVDFSHKLMGAGGTVDVSALPLFSSLEFLPGGKKITAFLDSSASYFQSSQPAQITTRISYKDAGETKLTQTIRHNLEIYRSIGYTTQPQ
jgi:hypothetical protein